MKKQARKPINLWVRVSVGSQPGSSSFWPKDHDDFENHPDFESCSFVEFIESSCLNGEYENHDFEALFDGPDDGNVAEVVVPEPVNQPFIKPDPELVPEAVRDDELLR